MKVRAYCVSREIDLVEFAREELGERWVESWEVPLKVGNAYIFSFGVVVFLGEEDGDLLRRVVKYAENPLPIPYTDEYEVVEGKRDRADDDRVELKELSEERIEVVVFAVAQSAALSRIEDVVDELEDEVEGILDTVRRPFPGTKNLRDMIVKALRLRHTLLSDLMILEPPAVTWEDAELERLYYWVRKAFDMDRRYRIVEKKIDDVLGVCSVATELISTSREFFLEAAIVLLIVLEILLWVYELWLA